MTEIEAVALINSAMEMCLGSLFLALLLMVAGGNLGYIARKLIDIRIIK